MEIFVRALLVSILVLIGGGWIGGSIKDFKEENYCSFGFGIMMAFTNAVFIVYCIIK